MNRKVTNIIFYFAALFFASACDRPELERATRTESPSIGEKIGNREQNIKASGSYIEITRLTQVSDENGKICEVIAGTLLYFDTYEESPSIWEFKLHNKISQCELGNYIKIAVNDFNIVDLTPISNDESIFEELKRESQPRETPGKEYAYESNDGFKDYVPPVVKKEYFPLPQFPILDYTVSGRQFGATRSGGRKHAANDLVENKGETVHAVADGKIIDYYYFYLGTYAIVVEHTDYVVRYGEVMSFAKGVKIGDQVKAGQTIGLVGQMSSGSSMLHFEKYTGSKTGSLTVRSNPPYQRRSDLVSPTSFLKRLEGQYP